MNDLEREETLRRLLTEAVEPIHPAAGAQTRLQALLHGQRRTTGRTRRSALAGLGWAATGLATAAIVVLAVIFAGRGGHSSSSASSTGARAAPAPAGHAAAGSSVAGSPQQSPPGALPVAVADLDGDGHVDSLSVAGGTLFAKLTRDGDQSIRLPAPGAGARVLGFTRLQFHAGGAEQVALVRLQERSGFAQDTVVAVVGRQLTVLRLGSGAALLTVDEAHGYACSDDELVVSGNPAPYVIEGDQLVPSPKLRAATVPVGRTTGC